MYEFLYRCVNSGIISRASESVKENNEQVVILRYPEDEKNTSFVKHFPNRIPRRVKTKINTCIKDWK